MDPVHPLTDLLLSLPFYLLGVGTVGLGLVMAVFAVAEATLEALRKRYRK